MTNKYGTSNESRRVITIHSRVAELHEVVPDLFEEHDDSHLQAKIDQTAARVTLK